MARSIQSPGVELREVDFTLRPASSEGTTVFVAGFADQGPIDEILQPASIGEFELIYGTPTNPAEQYFFQTAKALFTTSPARVLTTRLPYGFERGEGFFNWRYSALAYPALAFKTTPESNISAVAQRVIFTIDDTTNEPLNSNNWSNLTALSGVAIGLANTVTQSGPASAVQIVFEIDGSDTVPTSGYLANYPDGVFVVSLDSSIVNDPAEVNVALTNLFNTDPFLSEFFTYNSSSGQKSLTIDIENKTPGATANGVGPEILRDSSVNVVGSPILNVQKIFGADAVTISVPGGEFVTSTEGFSGANVYFFGKPSYIELDQEQYNALITENINWANRPTTPSVNTPLTFENIGDAGLIIVNKAQVAMNNSFEGYYVGIIDNNNYNNATPFNGVRYVEGVQFNSAGTNSYVRVPSTRLNFSLSADSNGSGSTISEIMENLTDYDLDDRGFDDTITIGVFKLRRSIFTPEPRILDYVLAESYVGSLDFHRTIPDTTGGPAKKFFVTDVVDSSTNIRAIVNPWISNRFSRPWESDTSRNPSKKVRFLSTQLQTPFNYQGFIDTYSSYVSRVGAPSGGPNSTPGVIDAVNTLGVTEALYPIGVYNAEISRDKNIGQLPLKLERAIELVENSDIFPINITVEAGLGTIFVNTIAQTEPTGLANPAYLSAGPYDDTRPLPSLSALYTTNTEGLGLLGSNIRSNYNAVVNPLINMAEKRRKDHIVILDPIRNIFVQGPNQKVINTKKIYSPNAGVGDNPRDGGFVTTNFGQHIFWPLRHQFGSINSSYAVSYANVAQVIEGQTNRQIWVPFSGFAAAAMANTDLNFNPWAAPAGFTRGIITGINDLGVYPRQNQRDQLYKAGINPVTFFPGEGFVIFGQKTTLKKPSAFDRINVRRLFLYLETITKNTLKYFVFEPNTLFTRTQVINTLAPVFENAKNTEGIYDYLIVCDERNNTPDVIDNNELKVDIYIKPVRTAEFILVSFYATRTGQNFQELVGG